MFYVIVAGSRTCTDYKLVEQNLDYLLQNKTEITIVQGGAKGADSLAKQYAEQRNYNIIEFTAEWNVFGKKAGYIRNRKMHEYIKQFPDRGCVCFWNGTSKGTQHNFELAKEFKTPLKIIKC